MKVGKLALRYYSFSKIADLLYVTTVTVSLENTLIFTIFLCKCFGRKEIQYFVQHISYFTTSQSHGEEMQ